VFYTTNGLFIFNCIKIVHSSRVVEKKIPHGENPVFVSGIGPNVEDSEPLGTGLDLYPAMDVGGEQCFDARQRVWPGECER
jgi:hypothetical protein